MTNKIDGVSQRTQQGTQQEQHREERWPMKPESIAILKKVCAGIDELKEKYPNIIGATFLGSHTKGLANSDSDVDMFIFTKGTANGIEHSVINNLKKYTNTNIDLKGIINLSEDTIPLNISNIIRIGQQDKNIAENFKKGNNTAENEIILQIIAPFFMESNTEIIKKRKLILDKIGNTIGGSTLVEEIAKIISFIENKNLPEDLPAYNNYPKTIDDAKKYFGREKYIETFGNTNPLLL
ncbi:MAG: nucleotidyltransferase domain-containing protein [Candidatus Pacebacteria bacterium]|nr:nucleotidyltransferase domain-containing protein [Candidatus Paceibacterota bacterium]MCF7863005.1 nucleotidyltransferase domain-containing protein [Candidatus Paceibacterota bacterium]